MKHRPIRSEFAQRLAALRSLGFTPGKEGPLPSPVKSLLVWHYGAGWPGKSPLQIPAERMVRFATQYLGFSITNEGGLKR